MDFQAIVDGKEREDRQDIDIVLKSAFQPKIIDRDTAVYQKFRIDKPSNRSVIMCNECLLPKTIDTVRIKCYTEYIESGKYRSTDIEKKGNEAQVCEPGNDQCVETEFPIMIFMFEQFELM
jgi:hypothetical protein